MVERDNVVTSYLQDGVFSAGAKLKVVLDKKIVFRLAYVKL